MNGFYCIWTGGVRISSAQLDNIYPTLPQLPTSRNKLPSIAVLFSVLHIFMGMHRNFCFKIKLSFYEWSPFLALRFSGVLKTDDTSLLFQTAIPMTYHKTRTTVDT